MIHIYAIKNVINNKMYIGSTKSIDKRKYFHFYHLKKGIHHSIHLQNSYNTYGKDKFHFYILEECTPENRKERELYFINFHKTHERDFGYNIYEPNENNFKCSDATKNKISINNPNTTEIDMYNLEGLFISTFKSISYCARTLSFNSGIISAILNGKRNSYKGHVFVLKGMPFNYIKSKKSRDMSNFYK